MEQLATYSLEAQTTESQFKALQQVERNERITVVLEDGGTASGSITSVVRNESADGREEIHVQFLDYESSFRDDDRPHHTVSAVRVEDEYDRAELTLPTLDSGRVRASTVGEVARIWSGLVPLHSQTSLSRTESKLVLLKEKGLETAEIAEKFGCDEFTVEQVFSTIQRKYWKATQTVEKLAKADIEPTRWNSPFSDWEPTRDQTDEEESKRSRDFSTESSPSRE